MVSQSNPIETELNLETDPHISRTTDYKYVFLGCIDFDTPYVVIADLKATYEGKTLLGKKNKQKYFKQINTRMQNFKVFHKVRHKDKWLCYAKIAKEVSTYVNTLDVVVVNEKLLRSLPQRTLFWRLEGLNWEWENSVEVDEWNLCLFDLKYFNDPSSISNINEGEKWEDYLSDKLIDIEGDGFTTPHGLVYFSGEKVFEIYGIRDSKSNELLAFDIEMQDTGDQNDDPPGYGYGYGYDNAAGYSNATGYGSGYYSRYANYNSYRGYGGYYGYGGYGNSYHFQRKPVLSADSVNTAKVKTI